MHWLTDSAAYQLSMARYALRQVRACREIVNWRPRQRQAYWLARAAEHRHQAAMLLRFKSFTLPQIHAGLTTPACSEGERQ